MKLIGATGCQSLSRHCCCAWMGPMVWYSISTVVVLTVAGSPAQMYIDWLQQLGTKETLLTLLSTIIYSKYAFVVEKMYITKKQSYASVTYVPLSLILIISSISVLYAFLSSTVPAKSFVA